MSVEKASPPFCSIEEAARRTGLSIYYIRNGCKAGTIPCVRSGVKFLVNVPAFLQQLGVPFSA